MRQKKIRCSCDPICPSSLIIRTNEIVFRDSVPTESWDRTIEINPASIDRIIAALQQAKRAQKGE
jgi:hypothetical protein